DGGDGRNEIVNTAHLDVGSSSSAQALGVSVGAELALGAGMTVADVEADATGLSVAANLAGRTQANADITADARATGITSGDGNDVVRNTAAMELAATSTANASAVSVTLAGTSRTDAKSNADTSVVAIDGAEGNDQIESRGD